MLNFLKRVGRVLQEAADNYELKCKTCGAVYKGQGLVDTCTKCGQRLQGSDRGD